MNTGLPAALTVHLAARVGAARRRYDKRLERSQKKFSPDSVHELRVETRRMLALLDLLEAAHFPCDLKKLRKTFKKRLDSFDDLRDTQVQLRLLKRLWPDFPEARPFRKWLGKRARRLVNRLRRRIKHMKHGGLDRRLKGVEKELLKEDRAALPPEAAAAALREAYERVLTLRRQIRRGNPAAIHRMRVAFKHFRYMSESLGPIFPDFTPERLGQMHQYQSAAGDIQDLEILLATLAQAVAESHVEAADVKKLRYQLLRTRRQRVAAFLERINDLLDFRPGMAALPGRSGAGPLSREPEPALPEALSA